MPEIASVFLRKLWKEVTIYGVPASLPYPPPNPQKQAISASTCLRTGARTTFLRHKHDYLLIHPDDRLNSSAEVVRVSGGKK